MKESEKVSVIRCELSPLPPCRWPPAGSAVHEDAAHRKWDGLHSQLLSLEESWLLPPSEVWPSSSAFCLIITFHYGKEEKCVFSLRLIITFFELKALSCLFVTMGSPAGLHKSRVCLLLLMSPPPPHLSSSLKVADSSTRHSDGTAGRIIGTQTLKELQTHISQLRELRLTATETLSEVQAPLSQNIHVTSTTHGYNMSFHTLVTPLYCMILVIILRSRDLYCKPYLFWKIRNIILTICISYPDL